MVKNILIFLCASALVLVISGFIQDDGMFVISVSTALVFLFIGLLLGNMSSSIKGNSAFVIVIAAFSTLGAPFFARLIKNLLP
jgi:hypothetical protein